MFYKIWVIIFMSFSITGQIPLESQEGSQNLFLDIPKEAFIFIRHGSTNWTVESLSEGPKDLEINDKGQNEAQLASKILAVEIERKLLKKPQNCVIISSSLRRAVTTANIISNHIHIPIIQNCGLIEKYFGDFRLNKKYCGESKSLIPIDAEPELKFQERILATVKEIFDNKEFHNHTKILVSHGEVFKYLSKILTSQKKTIPHGKIAIFIPPEKDKYLWTIELLPE